jgi:cytochrome c peroxidase
MLRVAVVLVAAAGCKGQPAKAELGARIFSDQALSNPPGQACADCHDPKHAFRDPESDHSTSAGVLPGRFGPRNAPTAMYARFVPSLHQDPQLGWVGGLFWDGRAGSLGEQAGMPLLNPIEMNNPDKAHVVATVRAAPYAGELRAIYGATALDDVDRGFANISDALAAYERTPQLAPFSSKYDHYLAGTTKLTAAEQRGLAIFEDPARGNCAGCHPSRPAADGTPPQFTNFAYANLGIPKYANSLFYKQVTELNPLGADYIDHGLATTTHDLAQDGKFRVPTLRNIARTAPYGHNGYFENLPYLLDFLNTRDVGSRDPATKPWAAPEIAANVETRIGHLGLTDKDIEDLEAFLETLDDTAP